ncbi:uncharacterized protein F4822DRAFT_430223 [Hypoxylon trugodes]|uniref:uncharacterized protein n=1 Tax=Hypoxylon trugodes TaxID=326681 RepID=UPI00219B6827|nr:uncharacterized protein F4822DRAFT_430223 [Hypoxylon trugodes]KAI1387476.1 hypothetical protein F4822DRAFT_430223 [Hypoxylon trugodes]
MGLTTYLTCLSALAGTAVSVWNDFSGLRPVLAASYDTAQLANIVPTPNVSLDYSLDTSANPRSSVSIVLQVDQPAVLLEAIGEVQRVVCTYGAVRVTFSNPAAFEQTILEWPRTGKFYLITNHLDNCNARGERGIYHVTGLSWDDDATTVTAKAVKTTIASIATFMSVDFSHGQGLSSNNSGNITFDEPGINVASNFSIPDDIDIFSAPPNFIAKADAGYLSDAAVIRGHFDYDVPSSQIQNLWFDIDAAFFGNLAVSFNVTSPLDNNNYSFSPGTFQPSEINVPSAFSLKPALHWTVGADVGTVGPLKHSSNITVSIPDGHAHVDFLNSNRSHAVGWGPKLTSAIDTSEAATGHASPFVDFSIEVALNVLDGRFNTTGGIIAKPQFVNDLTVPQSQTRIRKADRMLWPRNATCTNGFEVRSTFNVTVDAFVADQWQKTLYNAELPVADECFPF